MISNQCALHFSMTETFQCMLVDVNFFASVFFCVKNACCKNVFKMEKAKRHKGIRKEARRVKTYNHARIQIIIDAQQIKTKCINQGGMQ